MKRWNILPPLVAAVILMSITSAKANWVVDPGFEDPGVWIDGTIYQGPNLWHNDGLLPSTDPLNIDNGTALNSLETENRHMYQVILFDQPGKLIGPAISMDYYANARTVSGSTNVFGLGVTYLRTLPQIGENLVDLYHLHIGFADRPQPGGWYSFSHTFTDADRYDFVGIIVRTVARNGHLDNASVTFDLVPVPLPASLILLGPAAITLLSLRSWKKRGKLR